MLTLYVCLLWPILLLYVVKKFWCQFPENGKKITSKHVWVVPINDRIVHLLVLCEIFTSILCVLVNYIQKFIIQQI